jgi:hypothetical protein
MEQNRFGHLVVQELFQKGYFTSVFKAYDESQNKGVFLQIITPIFSSNKGYNSLLADYAKKHNFPSSSSILPVSDVITDSERIGLVYELPTGLSHEWNNFTSTDTQTSSVVSDACQKALATAFTFLMKNNVLHRALRPDSIAFHEASNQAFLTLCGHFEALFYLETGQNPVYQGQFQAHFYKTERLGSFAHYDINDDYHGFAKTWQYFALTGNATPDKTIRSNLQAPRISSENPLAEQLNVLLGGNLQAKHHTFAESFHHVAPTAPIEEKHIEQELQGVQVPIVEEMSPVIEEKPKVEFPPFEQPTVIERNEEEERAQVEREKGEVTTALFPWKKYAAVAGGLAALTMLVVYFYTNQTESKVEQPKQHVVEAKNTDDTNEEKFPSIEKENKTPSPVKTPNIEEPLTETKLNPGKVTASNTPSPLPVSSVFSTLDSSYGISQLEEISKLIDRSNALSASDCTLLISKIRFIYDALPTLVTQLPSSDQRKLCNYRSKFANHLRRSGSSVNNSIEIILEPYCN